jgi:hypothetical protein
VIVTFHERRTDVRTSARIDVAWKDLVAIVHRRRGEKDGRGVTFATYREGCTCRREFCPGADGHRIDENVLEVTALGLDLDKRLLPDGQQADIDAPTAQAAIERLAALGLQAWIYSTHSATLGRPSLRAIIALSRPVPRADWRRFWKAAIGYLGIFVQSACQNEARFWYLPSAPEGAEVFNHALPGRPLDVDTILASAPPAEPEAPAIERDAEWVTDPATIERARASLAQHGPAIEGQGGDQHTFQAACKLRDWGLAEDEALALLEEWNATCQPPWANDELEVKLANAYRYARGTEGARQLDAAVADGLVGALQRPFELASLASASPVVDVWYDRTAAVNLIRARADEPWISIGVGEHQIDEVRAGGTVTLQGPTGAGKTSLVAEILRRFCRTTLGWSVALSAELSADEFVARLVGIELGVYWKQVLRGEVSDPDMLRALPERLLVADGVGANLTALDTRLRLLRQDVGSDAPILAAVDYGQIIEAPGREVRERVAAVWRALNDIGRRHRAVMLVLSQMSRSASKAARAGERLGAEALDGGAETAAIERWSTLVLEIGAVGEENGEGQRDVSLSLAKGRMSGGDRVLPMFYEGRTGRWQVSGEARPASEVKAEKVEKAAEQRAEREDEVMFEAVVSAFRSGRRLCQRDWIKEGVLGDKPTRAALKRLVTAGRLRVVSEPRWRSKDVDVYEPAHVAPRAPAV